MFSPVESCWVCGGTSLRRYHEDRFDFRNFAAQAPELHEYTGRTVWLVRCAACGHGQPEQLPTLPRFFDRMYDQRWDDRWIEQEFSGHSKDLIFRGILRELKTRVSARPRSLLDIGAHAGRFMFLAQRAGWTVEGIELNPRTAAYAERLTGAPVRQANAHELRAEGRRYAAVTLTDVLEHIPDPMPLLAVIAGLVEPGGCIAVKVPSGGNQDIKERILRATGWRRASIAANLVHVNHFSVRSLRLALERTGFTRVTVRTGAPELWPLTSHAARAALRNAVRLSLYAAARLPGAVRTPLALNLQAFATKPGR